jgi:hypothetical protein
LEVIVMRHRLRPGAGRVVAVAVVAGAAVLATGCSSGPGGTPVASLSGHAAASSPQALTEAQGDQNMISFTRCMRGHGVQMPDPFHRPGHAGLSIDMPSRGPATNTAYAVCNHYIQANITAKQAGAAAQAAPHLAALTRYAQCMRSHDINMLDPTQLGELNLGHVPGITSDFGRYSPQFRAADAACRHFLPAGVRDDGTGP